MAIKHKNKLLKIYLISFLVLIELLLIFSHAYVLEKVSNLTALNLVLFSGLAVMSSVLIKERTFRQIVLSLLLPIAGLSLNVFFGLTSYTLEFVLTFSVIIPLILVKLYERKTLLSILIVHAALRCVNIFIVFNLVTHIFSVASLVLGYGSIIVGGIYLKRQIEYVEYKYEKKVNNLERYLKRLIEVGNSTCIVEGDMERTYEQVARDTAQTLDVSRVSIWEFDADYNSISCKVLYEQNQLCEVKDLHMQRNDYPNYFSSVLSKRLVIAREIAFKKLCC